MRPADVLRRHADLHDILGTAEMQQGVARLCVAQMDGVSLDAGYEVARIWIDDFDQGGGLPERPDASTRRRVTRLTR